MIVNLCTWRWTVESHTRSKFFAIVFLFVGVSATVSLLLIALNENINLFYSMYLAKSSAVKHHAVLLFEPVGWWSRGA